MNRPRHITFTGIDDRTNLDVADKLASQYPIEWGVLLYDNNRDSRFPCKQAIAEIMHISGAKAAHVCGSLSREVQAGRWTSLQYAQFSLFNRVQVNGVRVNKTHFSLLQDQLGVEVIYQVRAEGFDPTSPFQQLFDCSGGEGLFPVKLPTVNEGQYVGFAGGMGPDTVVTYLDLIETSGDFWIDMEGRVRSNGWFDLAKVAKVCDQVFNR